MRRRILRRLPGAAAASFVVLAIVLAIAPAALADGRDPRCADWERSGPPPGLDMAVACPDAIDPRTEDLGLGQEPLMPYIVGLLVMAAVLAVFGVVAMRVTARPSLRERRHAAAWWTCPSCGSPNQPARIECFACQARRSETASTHPA